MLLNKSSYHVGILGRCTLLTNLAYGITGIGNLLMIGLYHASLPQEMKIKIAYGFVYLICMGFLPALLFTTVLLVAQKRKRLLSKETLENHLKFVFLGIFSFIVLNGHNFLLSLLR